MRRPSIFEIATAFEDGQEGEIKQPQKPRTNIVIHTNRLYPGNNSTASAFQSIAYDETGNRVDSIKGYFLEPKIDYHLAKKEGKKRAITSGQYNVIPKYKMLNKENEKREKYGEPKIKDLKYDWYIDNPPGRSFVAIHSGKTWEHTTGCLLPGDTIEYNNQTQDYTIKNSLQKEMNFSSSSIIMEGTVYKSI